MSNIAIIIKTYAIVNLIAGIIVWMCTVGNGDSEISVLIIIGTMVSSMGIFATGEIIELLQDIKNNTKHLLTINGEDNNLPSL